MTWGVLFRKYLRMELSLTGPFSCFPRSIDVAADDMLQDLRALDMMRAYDRQEQGQWNREAPCSP
jgi:hypothetical protein